MLDVLFHDEFPLEPESDAGHDLPVDNGLMILSCVVRRGTDATYPVHADVGRKLPADLVAQAQTELNNGDAAAASKLRIVLAVKVDFGFRLQDQPMGDNRTKGRRSRQEGGRTGKS